MKRWSVVSMFVVIVGAGVVLAPSSASAGGWAVSTVDPMKAPVAGTAIAVGFTIRQHGVRPTNPEGRVGIGIESSAGVERFFPAVPRGPKGHYVARVRFAEPGAYRWSISQGWFRAQDLGRIDVPAASAATLVGTAGSHGDSSYRGSALVRLLLPTLGIALGAFAVAEAVRARRRRSRELIAT
jgi:hypothetical protein